MSKRGGEQLDIENRVTLATSARILGYPYGAVVYRFNQGLIPSIKAGTQHLVTIEDVKKVMDEQGYTPRKATPLTAAKAS